jgi:Fe-S oxidoreductase
VKGFDLITPGWGREQLEKETRRVYEVCDGCRRCFNLCPSFNTLFDRIDRWDSDVAKMSEDDFERVAAECYYCKLCYNHCPYTPPHHYEIDFPHLMIAWKQHIAREKGVSWRDRLLTRTDLIGKMGSRAAPIVNRLMASAPVRTILERLLGIHRKRRVLPFASEPLSAWWARHRRTLKNKGTNGKVALFAGCLVNYQATEVGKAALQVLEKNGVEVVLPPQQCCGMPSFDFGDTEAIIQAAKCNLRTFTPWLERGYDIVAPVPSCSLMFKREYPALLPGGEATLLSQRTFDICEYLMRLKRTGALTTDFVYNPGRIAYQVPCHLRDQNIGFKSKELLELTGAKVEVIERCSGHDGTWSAKTEFFDLSMGIAAKAVREIDSDSVDRVASDCPLAALQLDQACSAGHDRHTVHPIEIIRDAYGLPK